MENVLTITQLLEYMKYTLRYQVKIWTNNIPEYISLFNGVFN